MPGMKRFVTYIYSYEDNRKGSNVGFAKIELRGDVFRLEIHLRRLLLSRSLCRIYLIRVENSTMIGFPVGKMEFANGTGDCSLGMSALKIAGSDYSIRDMDGLMLSDEEKEQAKKDMGSMLDYIDKLGELDTTDVEPMSHVFPVNNVFREDVVTNGDDRDNIIANAPEEKDGSFVVPKTFD